jgi:hypothetical protein
MQNRAHLAGRLITRIYAVSVLLLGCAMTLIGLMMFRVVHIGSEPVPIIAAFLVPGFVFVILSVFIWRHRAWALSAAWMLALLYWFLIWNESRLYLPLIVIPIAFAALAFSALFYARSGGRAP